MRISYYKANPDSESEIAKISTIKKLLKSRGGEDWTEHYDRNSYMFEVTTIKLEGNNSQFTYNHHL
jgi:hypothetical protein